MIKIKYEAENNRSAAYDESLEIGESTFSKAKDFWIIDHTFVEKEYGGQGIATKLVSELVDQARNNNIKIMPLCPFAKKEFDKRQEYSDVLMK